MDIDTIPSDRFPPCDSIVADGHAWAAEHNGNSFRGHNNTTRGCSVVHRDRDNRREWNTIRVSTTKTDFYTAYEKVGLHMFSRQERAVDTRYPCTCAYERGPFHQ